MQVELTRDEAVAVFASRLRKKKAYKRRLLSVLFVAVLGVLGSAIITLWLDVWNDLIQAGVVFVLLSPTGYFYFLFEGRLYQAAKKEYDERSRIFGET